MWTLLGLIALGGDAFAQGGWIRQFPTFSPSGRQGHAMVFDEVQQGVILFGGMNQISMPVETWRWSGSTWSQVASVGPPGRYNHAMAYDIQRSRCVMFGGIDGFAPLGDTWEWDGASWTLVSITGPSARHLHAMSFDSWRNKVVLFGGTAVGANSAETWEWDGTTWNQRLVSGPSARQGSTMAFDATRGRSVLYGGLNGDTWEWDGSQWLARLFASGPPASRAVRLVFDELRNVCVLLAYRGLTSPTPETWHWNGTMWSLQTSTGPSTRTDFGMAFDRRLQTSILFGGLQGGGLSDTWEWRKPGTASAFGSGCGNPPLEIRVVPSARPAIGATAQATIHNVPSAYVFMALGWNNVSFGAFSLPVDLSSFGMPGCQLLHSAEAPTQPAHLSSPTDATYALGIPNLTALVGTRLFLQGWAVAPTVNLGEKVTSNAIEWRIGY